MISNFSLIKNALDFLEEESSKLLRWRACGFIEAILVIEGIFSLNKKLDYRTKVENRKFLFIPYKKIIKENYEEIIIRKANEYLYGNQKQKD